MEIGGFQRLLVWQKAIDLTLIIYKLTEKLPDTEKYGLVTQMRRCSVSVPSNIAEGYGRYSVPELIHFLRISRGSLYELLTQTIICNMLGFISDENKNLIDEKSQEIDKMITVFINKLQGKSQIKD